MEQYEDGVLRCSVDLRPYNQPLFHYRHHIRSLWLMMPVFYRNQ